MWGKEKDRSLKEQFINVINGDVMMTEIIKELTTTKEVNEITSEQVFFWAIRVKEQSPRKH